MLLLAALGLARAADSDVICALPGDETAKNVIPYDIGVVGKAPHRVLAAQVVNADGRSTHLCLQKVPKGKPKPLERSGCELRSVAYEASNLTIKWFCNSDEETEWGSDVTHTYAYDGKQFPPRPQIAKRSEYDTVSRAVGDALIAGKVGVAYGLVAEHHTRLHHENADTARRRLLFDMFLEAIHSKAKAAHDAGKPDEASSLVKFLLTYPPVEDEHADGRYALIAFHGPAMTAEPTDINNRRLTDMAKYLQSTGDYKLASEILEQVTHYDPDLAEAWLNLGDALWMRGKPEAGGKAYESYKDKAGDGANIPPHVTERLKTLQ